MEQQRDEIRGTEQSSRLRRPGITGVSLLFSFVVILFIFIGYRVQSRDFNSGILISEFGLILLPALLFLLIFRYDLKKVLRLNGAPWINILLVPAIMLFAIPLAGAFNLLNLWLVNSMFGKVILQQPPVAQNGHELLLSILVIAGSAGVCEEFLFRGVILRGLERIGIVRAILLTAILFGFMHMDFQKILGTFLLGALIGFLVYRSNSIIVGMYAHFTNNAVAVLVTYASSKWMHVLGGNGMKMQKELDISQIFSAFSELSAGQLAMILFVYAFLFVIAATLFAMLIGAFLRVNRKEKRKPVALGEADAAAVSTDAEKSPGLLWLLPGLLLILFIYYLEVMKFNGVDNTLIWTVRQILGI